MIASLHLADLGSRDGLGALREQPDPRRVPGLRYADLMAGAGLSGSLLPRAAPGRAGLFAVWEDEGALERFLATAPIARRLAGGWLARLEPLRASGTWTGMPALVDGDARPTDPEEPVAVLTLGRLRPRAALAFLQASAAAEGQALRDRAMLAGTGLGRPPRTVATFSLWRSARAMDGYRHGAEHLAAMRGMSEHRFHSESLFARFRPYATSGSWDGRDPLAAPA